MNLCPHCQIPMQQLQHQSMSRFAPFAISDISGADRMRLLRIKTMQCNALRPEFDPHKIEAYSFYRMKRKRRRPAERPQLEELVLEFLDLVHWKLNRILDQEGVSMLQWAFLQRALLFGGEVPFQQVLHETGESKDNVRRAAAFLEKSELATVRQDPDDKRARLLSLTKRGTRRANQIRRVFRGKILESLGVKGAASQRAILFSRAFWKASAFLESGDLADRDLREHRKKNRAEIRDDVEHYQAESTPTQASAWAKDDNFEIPW